MHFRDFGEISLVTSTPNSITRTISTETLDLRECLYFSASFLFGTLAVARDARHCSRSIFPFSFSIFLHNYRVSYHTPISVSFSSHSPRGSYHETWHPTWQPGTGLWIECHMRDIQRRASDSENSMNSNMKRITNFGTLYLCKY